MKKLQIFVFHGLIRMAGMAGLLICMSPGVWSQTFTSIASGNWGTGSTWAGGTAPPAIITAAQTIIINHSVTYNLSSDLELNGLMRVESIYPAPNAPGALILPTGRNFTVKATGRMIVNYGQIQQCRFTTCGDTGLLQAGLLKNEGGQMTVTFSNIEIAQDWTNESGGRRVVRNSCVKTGQNFSLSGPTSYDELQNTSISVGWHGSGSIQHSDGTGIYGPGVKFQLAGTSGSLQLNSGSVSGSIEYVTLKNHVTNVTGGGQISASSSLNVGTGLSLAAYWLNPASNYLPNGKFSGSQTRTDITSTYFPDSSCTFANTFVPTPLGCATLYGSYSGTASSTFFIKSLSTSSGTASTVVTLPTALTDSRGSAAAITPDGRYYYYRGNASNTLRIYDSLAATVTNTLVNLGADHFRMGINPTGTFGYVSRQSSFTRFLVAAPYTTTNMTVIEQGAPPGLEYINRAGGDIAFDSLGYGYSVARRGGAAADQFDNFLYRLEFASSSNNVTATYLGQITSSNATFTTFDANGVAFLNGNLYVGGGATALGNDAQLWQINVNTRQASLVGTDTADSDNVPVTDLASCQYPSVLLPASLAVNKTNATSTLVAGQTTSYTLTYTNAGPYPVYNALVLDTPSSGLASCSVASCTPAGGSVCPAGFTGFFAPAGGTQLPQLNAVGSVIIVVQCGVTATGL